MAVLKPGEDAKFKETEMERYLYLSMTPEALIASMLPPEAFGTYMAVGTKELSRGRVLFFELQQFESDYFDFSSLEKRVQPHEDGSVKHSVYFSIYRVLEHVPLNALGNLWLTTRDGRSLKLQQSDNIPPSSGSYHLYEEICPATPLITSILDPMTFCRSITDSARPIYVPKICFVEMDLAGLADDPQNGATTNLPYSHLDHLRDRLLVLAQRKNKNIKTFDRIQRSEFPFRSVKGAFYVGDNKTVLCYPYPTVDELDREHHEWWRSATV